MDGESWTADARGIKEQGPNASQRDSKCRLTVNLIETNRIQQTQN